MLRIPVKVINSHREGDQPGYRGCFTLGITLGPFSLSHFLGNHFNIFHTQEYWVLDLGDGLFSQGPILASPVKFRRLFRLQPKPDDSQFVSLLDVDCIKTKSVCCFHLQTRRVIHLDFKHVTLLSNLSHLVGLRYNIYNATKSPVTKVQSVFIWHSLGSSKHKSGIGRRIYGANKLCWRVHFGILRKLSQKSELCHIGDIAGDVGGWEESRWGNTPFSRPTQRLNPKGKLFFFRLEVY